VHHARAEALRLAGGHVHELGAGDALLEAGIVLHLGGGGELTAGLRAVDQHGLEVGAGGVDRGGEARGAGAQDRDVFHRLDHVRCDLKSASQALQAGFHVGLVEESESSR
jgi:hypothetical protein